MKKEILKLGKVLEKQTQKTINGGFSRSYKHEPGCYSNWSDCLLEKQNFLAYNVSEGSNSSCVVIGSCQLPNGLEGCEARAYC